MGHPGLLDLFLWEEPMVLQHVGAEATSIVVGWVLAIDDPAPADDFPGAELVAQILGWLKYLALAGSLASLLIGGAVWGLSQHSGNTIGASRGRAYALGGAAGAIVTGLAATVVNQLAGVQ
jgi:hypothetical protein